MRRSGRTLMGDEDRYLGIDFLKEPSSKETYYPPNDIGARYGSVRRHGKSA